MLSMFLVNAFSLDSIGFSWVEMRLGAAARVDGHDDPVIAFARQATTRFNVSAGGG